MVLYFVTSHITCHTREVKHQTVQGFAEMTTFYDLEGVRTIFFVYKKGKM